jgi:hypothetical protein
MSKARFWPAFFFGTVSVGGCASLPDLPGDIELPVKEIILHSACELRDTFRSLTAPEFKRFKAEQWLISVTLTPKVDTSLTFGGAWTRRDAPASRLVTWVFGTGPGIQYEAKGQRSGAATYSIKSKQLIEDKSMPCDRDTPSWHALTRELRVADWLRRSVSTANKPSFNSEITIKFNGTGSYTFAFPKGSDFGSLGGSYQVNQQLQIAMTPLTPSREFTVVTLPAGDNWDRKQARIALEADVAVQNAKSRLDIIQLEQAIQSIRSSQ